MLGYDLADRRVPHRGGRNTSADLHRRASARRQGGGGRTDQAGRGARQQLREPHSKALGDGLFELRRNQVRLFYMFEPGQTIRLLGGMVKKQDRIPSDVLAQMRGYQKDAREWLKKANTEKKR